MHPLPLISPNKLSLSASTFLAQQNLFQSQIDRQGPLLGLGVSANKFSITNQLWARLQNGHRYPCLISRGEIVAKLGLGSAR
jgi:hypothetical protein